MLLCNLLNVVASLTDGYNYDAVCFRATYYCTRSLSDMLL